AGAAGGRLGDGPRQSTLLRLRPLPAPVLRVRGDARVREQDRLPPPRPVRGRAVPLLRQPAHGPPAARPLRPTPDRGPGRGGHLLLLPALRPSRRGRVRLLGRQPRELLE